MLKVMIVDNETAIRKGLIHCIRWENLDCIITAQAEDGIDALEQLPSVKPDIVISDIRMPGMDGLELAREIREHYPRIKVIILTGFPDFEYAQQAITYQVVDFVLKPTSVESLTRSIEKAKLYITEERVGQELKQKLANEEEQNLVLQRELLLRDLIRGTKFSQLYLLNRMAQLEIDLTSYYILLLDISSLAEGSILEPDDEKLIMFSGQVQTVISECLNDCTVFFIPWNDQKSYSIVQSIADFPVQERCTEAINILSSLPQFTLSIGISSYCNRPLLMSHAAEEADQAAQFAKFSSDIPVMNIKQIPAIPQLVMERIYSDLHLLKSAIENNNAAVTKDILNQLFRYIRHNKLPIDTVRNICLYIYQFCSSLLFLPDSERHLSENSVSMLKRLIEGTTVDCLEQNMFSFVEQILNQPAGSEEEADNLVQTVKAYIAQHYKGDLSLENLAQQVFITPGYLSRLFKRKVGINLSTYVQNARINEAKILLRITPLKIHEVAERVGIPDPVYFSRTFKKITGVKPKDYRQTEYKDTVLDDDKLS
ncbi:MAG: response regulator [Lachnospiraceae bacterium]